MKLVPYLLVNLLVVGSGLFLYDTLKQDPAPTHYVSSIASEEPADPVPDNLGSHSVVLTGGDADFLSKRNKVRLDELEAALMLIRRTPTASGSGTDASGSVANRDPIELPPVIEGDPSSFDEKTLATLKNYMDEIRKREDDQRRKDGIMQELARLDVKLSVPQSESVVDATLKYQDRARDVMRQGFDRTEEGQAARREAFEGLRTEYVSVVHSLVPSAEAEKITSGRLGRSFGFMGRGGDDGGTATPRFAGARRGGGGAGGEGGR